MFRTDAAGNVAGMYDEGDPLIPREATVVSAAALNSFQEEIIGPIEAAGHTLNKANNGQLNQALIATYGRLGSMNTWTLAQTFSGNVSVGGTFGAIGNATLGGTLSVTGNTSLGGTLGVTATTTLSGPTNLNGATTVNGTLSSAAGGEGLAAKPGSADHAFVGFYARTASPTSRSGYVGYGGAGFTSLVLGNLLTGGNVELIPGTNGKVVATGNVEITATAPASTTAISNTLTKANITKVQAGGTTNATTGAVTLTEAFNVASVTIANPELIINFASAFASTGYIAVGTVDSNAGAAVSMVVSGRTATQVKFLFKKGDSTNVAPGVGGTAMTFNVIVTGAQ